MSDGLLVRGSIFALAAPGANVDLFATAITPVKAAAFRVTVSLNGASALNATFRQGATTKTSTLNGGVALVGSSLYTFTFSVRPDTAYNFQLGSNVAVDYMQVEEAYLGAP